MTASFASWQNSGRRESSSIFQTPFSSACRHTYAVQLAEAGYSQSDLLYLTRHDSVNELQRYMSHITPEMERKNKEAAYLFEKIIA